MAGGSERHPLPNRRSDRVPDPGSSRQNGAGAHPSPNWRSDRLPDPGSSRQNRAGRAPVRPGRLRCGDRHRDPPPTGRPGRQGPRRHH
ncbi:MAG: hypothetical protein AVDCRST_MAG20-2295 [uncultured Acidimicrobiales bacterium]|uniref:Uncharacterized protein n=1 Tax=uncultured Acidimicrobiales bacterium TaxID=310071 RepID=A0A6J4IH27_9ACTN|nr:MAG: hypothetical protein AVDCRST_MAG20-2295 [uncultured Acidimicrobiales bacterium]